MPLNPNGKIDKPALPFPDTALAPRQNKAQNEKLTPTESKLAEIWGHLLPSAASPMPLDESFFDLGGHSVLATRLIFEIRNKLAIKVPLGVVFDYPALRDLARELDRIGSDDYGLAAVTDKNAPPPATGAVDYAADLTTLTASLPASFAASAENKASTVFLTGATGFLGAYILRDLLAQPAIEKVVCLVRAATAAEGLERLKKGCSDRCAWSDKWTQEDRLQVLVGDLDQPHFGLGDAAWARLSHEVDTIVHNGALVRVKQRTRFQMTQTDLPGLCIPSGPLGLPLHSTSTSKRGRHHDGA